MKADEIIIDSFAGGGGASSGIERALGRPVDVAINHSPAAIEMHRANHPDTLHLTEDVFRVDPRKATGGKPVGLMWLSPDCRHFSRAKGGKPVKKEIRGLAWVAIKWAADVRPRVIVLENVREFEQWGPLVPLWGCECGWKGTEGQTKLARRGKRACPRCEATALAATGQEVPDPARKGVTFKQFVGRLKALGYVVDWKVLNASDFGAPTHRRRLFLIARRDGRPIVWPEETHGDPAKIGRDLFTGELKPWRTAAECIDWSIPCPSIFGRKKPLAEKTLKRIAMGVKRYVLDAARPFLVDMQRENRPRGTDEPVGTVTTQDNRFNIVVPVVEPATENSSYPQPCYCPHCGAEEKAWKGAKCRTCKKPGPYSVGPAEDQPDGKLYIADPFITPVTHAGERRPHSGAEPLPTVTGANRGELGLIAPVVTRLGQTGGNGAYSNPPDEPLTTVTSKAEHLLIAPIVANLAHGDAKDGRDRGLRAGEATAPLGTVHAGGGSYALIAPTLVGCGGPSRTGEPRDVERPLNTVMPKDARCLVSACLYPRNGEREGQAPRCGSVETPLPTVVQTGNGAQLVSAFLARHFGGSVGAAADAPAPTVTGGGQGKSAVVAAFVAKHFGGMVGVPADTPLPTTTARGTQNQLAVANLVHMNHGDKQWNGADEPLRTVTTGGHAALVYSFLVRYFGTAIGQHLTAPLFTVTGKDRFGLVTVSIAGDPYVIVDIGMRMLKPRELARAQGFHASYVLTGTNTNQVERIGNSVCPDVAHAIVKANCPDLIAKGMAA